MIVWRVENKEGFGPYQALDDYGWDHQNQDHQPRPWDDLDFDGHEIRDYRFGFSSQEQMQAWFGDKDRAFLASHGFELVLYDVPPDAILTGEKQVAFKRDQSTLIERRTL